MPADPATAALIRGFDRQVAGLRQRVRGFALGLWNRLGDYRDPDIGAWIATVAPVLDAAQQQTATLTAAYLSTLEAITLGHPVRPVPLPKELATTEALRGVSTDDVLGRPALELYTALGNDVPFPEAVARGADRAASLVDTDLQLAKTHSARHVAESSLNVVGHRRSLNGPRSCALCIVASTQRYHKADLQPIHPGCDCGVIHIYGRRDPGQVIAPNTLDDLHDRLAQRFGAFESGSREIPGHTLEGSGDPLAYRDVLVVHEHGEIGPVLGVRGQDFTGPNDL